MKLQHPHFCWDLGDLKACLGPEDHLLMWPRHVSGRLVLVVSRRPESLLFESLLVTWQLVSPRKSDPRERKVVEATVSL